jgi:hypothetical protein
LSVAFLGDSMPHRHSPNSKHVKAKRLRYQILLEYKLLPKIYDPRSGEVISINDSKHFVKGEVLISPKHISPVLKE